MCRSLLVPLLLLRRTARGLHTLQPTALDATGHCQSLDASPPLTIVWAWSNGMRIEDLSRALEVTLKARPGSHARLYCGNTQCLEVASQLAASGACITAQRLFVQELAKGTPAEAWCHHHILAKVLAGPEYEHHLQVVMQLAALWWHGGTVALPGIPLPANAAAGETWIGTDSTDSSVSAEHGLLAVSAGDPRPDLASAMLRSIVGAYPKLHAYDLHYNYSNQNWPLSINWQRVLGAADENATRREPVTCMAAVPRSPWPVQYGALSFYERRKSLLQVENHAMNIGDEMQQFAGLQFMPHVSAYLERDDMNKAWADQGRWGNVSGQMVMFANAWYGSTTAVWPPPDSIKPVLLALHFEGDTPKLYNSTESTSYLKRHWPVGTRDEVTKDYLAASNVPAFFSGDMTFTLQPMCDRQALAQAGQLNQVVVIDVHEDVLEKIVPQATRDSAVTDVMFGSHIVELDEHDVANHELARYASAYAHLHQYACEAKLLITQRLHAAMPAAAMGTPVLLIDDADTIPGGGGETRLSGLAKFVHVATVQNGAPGDFDWDEPPPNPLSDQRLELKRGMRDTLACHEPGLVDAGIKFGALPEEFASLTADTNTCAEPVPADAIHIATAINAEHLQVGQGVAIASWANSLGQSYHESNLAIYMLTDGLTNVQQCMARVLLRRHLSNTSKVYTISVEKLLNESTARSTDLKNVSRITMARLMMPTLMPCMEESLWVDVDT